MKHQHTLTLACHQLLMNLKPYCHWASFNHKIVPCSRCIVCATTPHLDFTTYHTTQRFFLCCNLGHIRDERRKCSSEMGNTCKIAPLSQPIQRTWGGGIVVHNIKYTSCWRGAGDIDIIGEIEKRFGFKLKKFRQYGSGRSSIEIY